VASERFKSGPRANEVAEHRNDAACAAYTAAMRVVAEASKTPRAEADSLIRTILGEVGVPLHYATSTR